MLWIKSLWHDEAGSILTAELVLLGTMGVVGATVGLRMMSDSVNEEMKELSHSIRHLDQSYEVKGFTGCRATTAGSKYQQEDVKKSIARLEQLECELEADQKKAEKERRELLEEYREKLRKEAEKENRKPSKKKSDDDD